MSAEPRREESFNGKEEVDETNNAPDALHTSKFDFHNEKEADLDVGAQV